MTTTVGPVLSMTAALGARRPAWSPPALLGGVGACGCVVLALSDPAGSSVLPSCPLLSATGYDCPGCGISRGIHALFRGDLFAAADHNVMLFLFLPIVAYAWLAWLGSTVGRRLPLPAPRSAVTVAAAGLVALWWVGRNLPVEALAFFDSAAF